MMRMPVVEVAVAIVRRSDGRVLLAERTPRQLSAGHWELPGGKIEAGETPAGAAARELAEEVGLRAHRLRPALCYEHVFRTRCIRLQFFHVEKWSGTPQGCEGQRLAWVDPADLDVAPILPSNTRMLRILGLPDLYVDCRTQPWIDIETQLVALGEALSAGARLLRLGTPDLPPDQRVALARRAQAQAASYLADLVLDGASMEIHRAGLLGIHTSQRAPGRLPLRPQVRLWIATCHDARDLAEAISAGADAAVVSPVLAADQRTGRPALGWKGLADLVRQSTIPVYAEGGVSHESRAEAIGHGAIGVACALVRSRAARPVSISRMAS